MECLFVEKDKVVVQRDKAVQLLESGDSMKIYIGLIIKKTLEALDLWEESSQNNPVLKE